MSKWYKLNQYNQLEEAPKNKNIIINGMNSLMCNYNLNEEQLLVDGYLKYNGNFNINRLKIENNQIIEISDEEYQNQIRQQQINQEKNMYNNWYTINPTLAIRVIEYKNYLDILKLPHTAKISDITTVIQQLIDKTDIEKLTLSMVISKAFDAIVLNLEEVGVDKANSFAWNNMQKLINYLPKDNSHEDLIENPLENNIEEVK